MRRLGFGLIVVACAACAGVFAGNAMQSEPPATASPQALAYFESMVRAAEETKLEQAACVSEWTFKLREAKLRLHVERVRPALIQHSHSDSVRFVCYASEGTVHTHSLVCIPSVTDRIGAEMFGVVVCPNPTRFAVFAVRPAP